MKSAGCSTLRPANAASSSWLRSMLRYQLMPPANVPWCCERLDEHVEIVVRQPVERTGGLAEHVEERPRRRVEEAELVAGHVARDPVEHRAEGAAEVGVELTLGDARAPGSRGGRGTRRPTRRAWRRWASPAGSALLRRHRSGRSGRRRRGTDRAGATRCASATGPPQSCPTTTAVSIPDASSTPTRSPTRCSMRVLVDARRHVGGAVAPLVGSEHVEPGVAERAQLVSPRVPALGEPVAQHDRRPVLGPRLGDVHADAVGVDVPMADRAAVVHLSARRGRGRRSGRG